MAELGNYIFFCKFCDYFCCLLLLCYWSRCTFSHNCQMVFYGLASMQICLKQMRIMAVTAPFLGFCISFVQNLIRSVPFGLWDAAIISCDGAFYVIGLLCASSTRANNIIVFAHMALLFSSMQLSNMKVFLCNKLVK